MTKKRFLVGAAVFALLLLGLVAWRFSQLAGSPSGSRTPGAPGAGARGGGRGGGSNVVGVDMHRARSNLAQASSITSSFFPRGS